MSRPALVNGAFRSQVVTGQQRYATEIGERLISNHGFGFLAPGEAAASALRNWAWVQTVPLMHRKSVLVSLTSRAPVAHPRHLTVVHDLFVLTDPQWYSTAYVRTHQPLLRWQLRNSSQLVAVSEPVAREVEEFNRTGRPVEVAPNAPSLIFCSGVGYSDVKSTMHKLGLTSKSFFLVVGSMDPRKNLARVADAYNKYVSAGGRNRLVVVGPSSRIFRDGAPNWPSGVIEAGYVSDTELAVLYAEASGVVFASLAEGFGLPAVEALASGARVAVSDIPVFRWVCGSDARYFNPSDPEAISAALIEMESDEDPPELRHARATRAKTRFAWDNSASIIARAAKALRQI